MQDAMRIVLFGVSEEDRALIAGQLAIISHRTGGFWEVKNSPGAHIAIVDTDSEEGQSALTWLQRSPLVIITFSRVIEVCQAESLALSKPLRTEALMKCLQLASSRIQETQQVSEHYSGFISLS